MAKILVADDEYGICEAFSVLLTAEGHTPLLASNGKEAVRMVRDEKPALVFMDARMPGGDGLDALMEIHALSPGLPVIIMTAFGTLETARKAMDLGAFDYLGKPVDLAKVRELLAQGLHKPASASATVTAHDETGKPALLGQSAAMQTLFKQMALLTDNELSILITGESGVGKELVARGIHELGPRADDAFVAVNCAAIPETLIEAELFGHEAGAFTDAKSRRIGRFEAAGVGTLFLDEISELPFHLQSKLLRVLQERTFERLGSVKPIDFTARLIAASNRDLEAEIAAGRFREDLYHRLNLATLLVPTLRDREDDIELLVTHFLRVANEDIGKEVTGVEPAVFTRLREHPWPGNVRELEHCIKRSVLATRGTTLTVHDLDLPPPVDNAGSDTSLRKLLAQQAAKIVRNPGDYGGEGGVYSHLIDAAGHELIQAALELTGGNQVAAAKLLGINRTTLRKRLSEPGA